MTTRRINTADMALSSPGQPGSPSGLEKHIPAAYPSVNELEQALAAARGGQGLDMEIEEGKMLLEFEDGTAYEGFAFGARKSVTGECVFSTGMTGYIESLTDPSYEGQILVMTYPMVGTYGVPPVAELLAEDVRKNVDFESSRVHVAGLVVQFASGEGAEYSNFLAETSLGKWLQKQGVPAICGVDTRLLTKRLREEGSKVARLLVSRTGADVSASLQAPLSSGFPEHRGYAVVPFHNANTDFLAQKVSRKEPVLLEPDTPVRHPVYNRPLRIVCLDVGLKLNQLRCLLKTGVQLFVVPWDYDFLSCDAIDGLFISNGPGDPAVMTTVVDRVGLAIQQARFPIFGICLGHQILGRAAGGTTAKLKYGNRGVNIPCTNVLTQQCFITSQNHGYAVDAKSLPQPWEELFVNANDGSNEGIYSKTRPYFSVQFHPESAPGPRDTEFLFDVFVDAVKKAVLSPEQGMSQPVTFPGELAAEAERKHPIQHVRKVLILGSGGISIGQAGEFDYSGSQAVKALSQEGIYTVLINPNIATIQTSKGMADKVYFVPVTPSFVKRVIELERPDGIYVTFGGQTALSVGIALKDYFVEQNVKVLGTPIQTVITSEDRDLFDQAMKEIDEKVAPSASAVSFEEARTAAHQIGFPVIVRAAFALGGLGSGFASNDAELEDLCHKAFSMSPQVLVEKSMKGWKEIEYEVVRDCRDNCITVCNMENFDPLGIHTGDSVVVAPSQTLSDADHHMLRSTAVKVIRHLGVVGECNIQYALNPHSREYCIIEVNARLSRSSALASKATGYPLAFIAAKLGLNIPLNAIANSVTKVTSACFEPSLDYCVVKIPRWDLRKFTRVSSLLSSSMKSVGEVMAIGHTFEETLQKAIRSVDPSFLGFSRNDKFSEDEAEIEHELTHPTDLRMMAIANALHIGWSVEKVHALTSIDKWFLNRLASVVRIEKSLASFTGPTAVPPLLLRHAKQMGFSDKQIGILVTSNELAVRRARLQHGVTPFVKQIDTVAGEFPASTNYLYLTYNASGHDIDFNDRGLIVLGSGVYRIGSSVEFDWCAVRCIRTLREQGYKTVMINYNPETVSTDYDEANRLYFENISIETVLDIYQTEFASGVIVSMGGQVSNNIALDLMRNGLKVLGTSPEMIDMAENRYKFSRMLDSIGVDQPEWKELSSMDDAYAFCDRVGYPVLVRPSYVLSGAAMNVVYSRDDLDEYLSQAVAINREHPVVVSKYIEDAKEIELDAVAANGKVTNLYISEHVENAGVHSGDATLIQPPQDLDPRTVRRIKEATAQIASSLSITGPFNIQFIAKDNLIKVIECNVRASRSFPFVSKVTGIDAIEMAAKAMVGISVPEFPKPTLRDGVMAIKVPQFSFSRLGGADPILGVEMASTGEVACFGESKYEAYLKALLATGMKLPKKNVMFSIGPFKEKLEMLPSVAKLASLGYNIYATSGTADFFSEHGVQVRYLEDLEDKDGDEVDPQKTKYSLSNHLANNLIDLYVNLPSKNRFRRPASYVSKGYRSRRMAIDRAVPLVTNVKCAKLFIEALCRFPTESSLPITSSVDAQSTHRTVVLPGGFVNIATYVNRDLSLLSQQALKSGFSALQVLPYDDVVISASRSLLDYHIAAAASATPSASGSIFLSQKSIHAMMEHFSAWPHGGPPFIADASVSELGTILLLASVVNRPLHVTNVSKPNDLYLIGVCKERGYKVTCDVSIYSLFLNRTDDFDVDCLPSKEDQETLWNQLGSIDALSVGCVPARLATALGKPVTGADGIRESIALVFNAVFEGRLTYDYVVSRLIRIPRAIFGWPDDTSTSVEIELDRLAEFSPTSPLANKTLYGSVTRVSRGDRTLVMDNKLIDVDGIEGRPLVSSGSKEAPSTAGRDVQLPLSPQIPATKALSSRPGPMPANIFSPSLQPQQPQQQPPLDGEDAFSLQPFTSPVNRMKQLAPQGSLQGSLTPVAPAAATSAPSVPRPFAETRTIAEVVNQNIDLLTKKTPFCLRHVLSVRHYSREHLHLLFHVATEMRKSVERRVPIDLLKGRVLCAAFYEPSSRTSCSFEAAMLRLGGGVSAIQADTSSVSKGESLPDTIRTLSSYSDAIVLRHPQPGSARIAAQVSPVPVINAGDGIGEHPTQAFLDVYTIREELGTVNGLNVTLVGDLKNGRTVHSLVRVLTNYSVTLNFVSPPSLAMPAEVTSIARRAGISVTETADLNSVIPHSDVLYVTRVQQERFASKEEYINVRNAYVINNQVMTHAKDSCVIMHPLPRNEELDPEVDVDTRRAAYFRQMRNGLFIRMALLAMVMND